MIWSKVKDWRVSDCGFYRIQPVSLPGKRPSSFRLQVQLIDGWIDYPESFRLVRDAKAVAARMEE